MKPSGVTRTASYQIDGIDCGRCGSFASIGLPDFVMLPSTTQLLLAGRPRCPRCAKPGARWNASFTPPNAAVIAGGGGSSGSVGYTGISAAISLGAIFGARFMYTDSSAAL